LGDIDVDVVDLIARSSLFGALPDSLRASIVPTASLERIAAGEVLFAQNDVADAAFVVASGRFVAVLEDDVDELFVRELVAGDTVGELALLAGGRRSASVRAVRDSVVLRIGKREFTRLIAGHPTFGAALLEALATQLQASGGLRRDDSRTPPVVAVVGTDDVRVEVICAGLTEQIEPWIPAVVLRPADRSEGWGQSVDNAERTSAMVLLPARLDASEWTAFCLRQADRVLVVGDSARPPPEHVAQCRGADLALLGTDVSAGAWLDAVEPPRRYALDESRLPATLGRLARRLSGRAIGLALSGGGARGLAHIGVLQVLEERGIVVDRVGGTSIGAFLGSMYAVGFPPGQMVHICRKELVERNAFDDYTLPRFSLIRAQKARRMLARVFGELRIENLDVDLFTTSADLASSELVLHRRGRLVDAVAASMSLPGFAPPLALDGRLLVDGGVLDNLPVGPMVDAAEGPVIAVDAMGRWDYGPESIRLPRIIETLARATVLGSRRHAEQGAARAAIAITPDISATKLFEFGRLGALIEAGRQAAGSALDAADSTTLVMRAAHR
jgi:NTE family protein